MGELQRLPSVDSLLKHKKVLPFVQSIGRQLVLDCIREVLVESRQEIRNGGNSVSEQKILSALVLKIDLLLKPAFIPLINATGVILHTNLGRAPLSQSALAAMQAVSGSYSSLEYDLEKGERSERSLPVEKLLTRLTTAESALVVNNNAAAVLLVLTTLAHRRRVIISRTQLIEIGGGFRVPDVMAQSGAKLVSIGTTNRVHLSDYAEALQASAALVLCAHHSNFRMIGFSSEPDLKEIAGLSHHADLPLVHDLGSGALLDTAKFGLAHEPTVQESLRAGADVVCFSGDKLLGGPQAGIIVGKNEFLVKIKKHPLARALRADKVCLAGLSATLMSYMKGKSEEEIPVWIMLAMPLKEIEQKVKKWIQILGVGEESAGESMVGGGSLPGENLPTVLLAIKVKQPNLFLKKLRSLPVPIIARVEKDRVLFDPRTILPQQEETFLSELKQVLTQPS